MSVTEVSLKKLYFALFDDGLTLKTLKWAFIGFFNSNSSYELIILFEHILW